MIMTDTGVVSSDQRCVRTGETSPAQRASKHADNPVSVLALPGAWRLTPLVIESPDPPAPDTLGGILFCEFKPFNRCAESALSRAEGFNPPA